MKRMVALLVVAALSPAVAGEPAQIDVRIGGKTSCRPFDSAVTP